MKSILSRESVGVLAQLAWSRVLLAFDFDGTLAPIVADRDAAKMRSKTRELLRALCAVYPCAVISGRSQADVSARLGGAAVKYVVGNHGLEPGAGLAGFERDIRAARELLGVALEGRQGVDIEDKRYSLAIHFRRARQKVATYQAIEEAVRALPIPMRKIPGKLVVNVIPAKAANKGDALLQLRATEQADTAFYIGDDATDEDVFELDQPGRLVTVRVGASRSSSAAYFVRRQLDVDRLLSELVRARDRRAKLSG